MSAFFQCPREASASARAPSGSTKVTYRGRWRFIADADASRGGLAYSTASGASASVTFNGYAVSWVAYRGPTRGSAEIYLDGAYIKTISLNASTSQPRKLVFAKRWSRNGTHTLKIVNLASAGHPRVDVDAFVRLRGL